MVKTIVFTIMAAEMTGYKNTIMIFVLFTYMFDLKPYEQTNKQTNKPTNHVHPLCAWVLVPLAHFLGPHLAFTLALQLSTSFTWEWALVWRKSTQWHFPQCHIYRPPHRARETISQSDTVSPPSHSAPADNHRLLSRRSRVETTICLCSEVTLPLVFYCCFAYNQRSTRRLPPSRPP